MGVGLLQIFPMLGKHVYLRIFLVTFYRFMKVVSGVPGLESTMTIVVLGKVSSGSKPEEDLPKTTNNDDRWIAWGCINVKLKTWNSFYLLL